MCKYIPVRTGTGHIHPVSPPLPPSLPPSHAHSLEGQTIPPECAIKVFKTTLNEFKNRDRYIKDDYRFKDRFGKQNPRKVVKLWAEKEMHNLKRYMVSYVCPKDPNSQQVVLQ